MSKKKTKVEKDRSIEQKCPVCGSVRLLTVHHLLPKYIFKEIKTDDRVYFLNGSNSYWLCAKCHSQYEKNYANVLKDALLNKFELPENARLGSTLNPDLARIKNLCRYMAGKYYKNNYNYSIYQAYNFVKNFYNKKYMTYDEIEKLCGISTGIPNPNFIPPGQFLLKHVKVRKLDYFYRRNFLEFLRDKKVKKGNNLIPEANKHYEI